MVMPKQKPKAFKRERQEAEAVQFLSVRGETNDCNCCLKLFLLLRKLPTACHCLKLLKFKERGQSL